jgi:Flp pilus assembly protein TadG
VRTKRRSREDQGSAAVEFALVLPVLLLIVFAIIDFGRMLNARIVLSQAAHEGARAVEITNDPAQAQARIDTTLGNLAGGVTGRDIVGCDVAPDATVTLTYTFSYVTPLAIFGGFGDESGATMTATAVVPCL